MKKITLGTALTILVSLPTFSLTAYAQSQNCANLSNSSQQRLNQCALEEYQDADRNLNSAWKIVKPHMDGISKAAGKALLEGQRGWIAYRDGHCGAQAAKYSGGSIEPFIANSCKADLTRHRTSEILDLMHEG